MVGEGRTRLAARDFRFPPPRERRVWLGAQGAGWGDALCRRGYWAPSESRRWPNSERKRSISGDRVAVGADLSEADREESTRES